MTAIAPPMPYRPAPPARPGLGLALGALAATTVPALIAAAFGFLVFDAARSAFDTPYALGNSQVSAFVLAWIFGLAALALAAAVFGLAIPAMIKGRIGLGMTAIAAALASPLAIVLLTVLYRSRDSLNPVL